MSATTATKPLPTAEQLKAYADQLPDIYRDVLSAFTTADPRRRYHGDLSLETILAHVHNRRQASGNAEVYDPQELMLALINLADAGFLVRVEPDPYYFPTEVGEELIAVLTGRRAPKLAVPDLPQPTW